jgi:hypothetical protein
MVIHQKQERTILSKNNIASIQLNHSLILRHKKKDLKLKFIKSGFLKSDRFMVVVTKDGTKIKGSYYVLSEDTLLVHSSKIAFSEIVVVKTARVFWQIVGVAATGYVVGGAIAAGPWGFVLIPFIPPAFAITLIRRRYNIDKKWELVILRQ